MSDDTLPDGIHLVNEKIGDLTQAISGKGCRPTRNWIFTKLKENYAYVYVPVSQPDHPEFPKNWNGPVSKGSESLIRAIFIASNHPIQNINLVDFLPKVYK